MVTPNDTIAAGPAVAFALPELDLRALARRAALPMLLALAAAAALLLASSHLHAVAGEVRRVLDLNPGWAILAVVLECASLAGYVALLSLVAGRAAPRVGVREGAQITFAGAAATRLLPTAGAGGLALALWALRQAGLSARAATRTLLVFLVLLYSVFLAAIALAGSVLALGLVSSHGPVELSAIPAAGAALAIALCLALAAGGGKAPAAGHRELDGDEHGWRASADRGERLAANARFAGAAVRDAAAFVRQTDARLAGAIAYWGFDAAVLWATLHALGTPPAVPVIVLAYFVGQVANTLPVPGSVSGGIAGVLLAFGVAPALALPAVLAYRTIAVWLPSPAAVASVSALRGTVARWREETGAARCADQRAAAA
ncbi:MAG TPA: lysylphosphatidylglycerol synthase domain-containing protein [Solirubrobacteraceae bacterium]|nr:lysylphosphatidylglycerol synthase domain-containing protein [Solirubrobacteraceae bacterium]